MPIAKYVRIKHAALADDDVGEIILRGQIDPDTLSALLVDDYQREVLPVKTINQIMEGFKAGGSVPDIDLGMRGHATRSNDEMYTLLNDVYIIDGQQRVNAARRFIQQGGVPRLGATIHFDTTREWEVQRFRILNADRIKVSPNVLVRNLRDQHVAVNELYNMCDNDRDFVMRGRVCWQQQKLRQQLLTVTTFMKSVGFLHMHLGPGGGNRVDELAQKIQRIYDRIGRLTFRHNVRAFYKMVDECWGISNVTYDGACYLKNTFLFTMARVISNHPVFWRDDKMFVDAQWMRKWQSFPIQDPTVLHISGAGGKANKYLYDMMIDHLNKGKRFKRLVPRKMVHEDLPEVAPIGITEEEEAVA